MLVGLLVELGLLLLLGFLLRLVFLHKVGYLLLLEVLGFHLSAIPAHIGLLVSLGLLVKVRPRYCKPN